MTKWTVAGDGISTEQRIKAVFQGLPELRNSGLLFKGIFSSKSTRPPSPALAPTIPLLHFPGIFLLLATIRLAVHGKQAGPL